MPYVSSFFFSSRRRHTRFDCDWSSDVCSSDLSAGRFILTLTLIFEDGSALCDNILVLVTTCSPTGRLDVIPTPKLAVYDPSDPSRSIVDLTVRLRNISQPKNGLPACNFLLRGANVLTCSAA